MIFGDWLGKDVEVIWASIEVVWVNIELVSARM